MRFLVFILMLTVVFGQIACSRQKALSKFPGTHNTDKPAWRYKQELKREYKAEMRKMKQVPRSEKQVQDWAFDAHTQNDDKRERTQFKIWLFWWNQTGAGKTKEQKQKAKEEEKKRQEKIKANRKKKREHRKRGD